MPSSLRRQLLAWVLLPLAGAVAVDTWLTYQSALDTASVVQDRLLQGSARMIAEQISFEDGSFQHQIPPAALELFRSEELDRIYYQVTTGTGQLLAGYPDLPAPSVSAPTDTPYFFSTVMRGKAVRAVVLFQPVIGNPSLLPVRVQVAQTTNSYTQLANRLWQQSALQQLLILVLVTIFITFGLNRGLLPLRTLRGLVRAREPGLLLPLHAPEMPTELVPLVDSLNDYIRRLEEHAGAQSIFVQNAAHQLRTPFAVLHTQISYALRATDGAQRTESLSAARRTLRQASRLVNQLLTLSAADALVPPSEAHPVALNSLATVVQDVFESLAGQAQTKAIDLGFESAGVVPRVRARAVVLREIVLNLVDNAIRYTPTGGSVTVRVTAIDGSANLVVEDNGPGIAAEHHARVFERFCRLSDSDSGGSGLGLAIVREFASKISAQVSLANAPHGNGLLVSVQFALS